MTLFLFDFRWGLVRWGAAGDNALWGQWAVSSDQRIRDPQVLRQGRIWRCDKGERDMLFFLLSIYPKMSFISVLTSILSLVILYNSLVSRKAACNLSQKYGKKRIIAPFTCKSVGFYDRSEINWTAGFMPSKEFHWILKANSLTRKSPEKSNFYQGWTMKMLSGKVTMKTRKNHKFI